jgi:acyl-CoA reductase-like NAD-dependent aldehyde dehydrogenase
MNPAVQSVPAADEASVSAQISAAREAQRAWSATPVKVRTQIAKQVRHAIAARAEEFALSSADLRARHIAEALTAEVLPLLEAHKWIEREAASLLAPQHLGRRGRPLWLSGVRSEIHREPLGVLLIVAPSNYPLFLPAAQVLQALTAGNAVLVKPAPCSTAPMARLRAAWLDAGLDPRLFVLLPEHAEVVGSCLAAGVDKVILTGSHATGRAVLRRCAETLTPAVMELSGCDAVIVREDADLALVTAALCFGLRLNAGATCVAPRRVFIARRIAERFEAQLAEALVREASPNVAVTEDVSSRAEFNGVKGSGRSEAEVAGSAAPSPKLVPLVREALADGASLLAGGISENNTLRLPLVLTDCRPSMPLLQADLFAPVLALVVCDSDAEAVALSRQCPFALGASVFSRDEATARALAAQLDVGTVTINDLIIPTADPRLPFAGRHASGFGATRGAAGLLEMTQIKTITRTRAKHRPQYAPVGQNEAHLFSAYAAFAHAGTWRARWSAAKALWQALRHFRRPSPPHS